MTQLFRIGGVYRQRNGSIVRLVPYTGALSGHFFSSEHGSAVSVESGKPLGPRGLAGGCVSAYDKGPFAGDLIPGELHQVDGAWVPITEQPMSVYFADAQEDKPAEAADKSPIERLRDLVAIQGSDGNWNCDEYMLGMFNGMELALAIMEDRDPVYRTLPKPAVVALPAAPTAHPAISGLTCLADRDHRFGLFRF